MSFFGSLSVFHRTYEHGCAPAHDHSHDNCALHVCLRLPAHLGPHEARCSERPASIGRVRFFRVRKQGAHTTRWQSKLEASPAPAAAVRKALCTHDAAKGPWPPSEDPESFYETSARSARAEAS